MRVLLRSAADALAPLPLERAERLGIVDRDGDAVRGSIRILPRVRPDLRMRPSS